MKVALSDAATAITSCSGGGGCAATSGCEAGEGVGVGVGEGAVFGASVESGAMAARAAGSTAFLATFLGLLAFFGLACGTLATAVACGGGAGYTRVSTAGSAATGGSSPAFTALCRGSAAATGAGASATGTSGTSTRRSCQGKPKPGSPSPWPPKVRLNSTRWAASENNSASGKRLRSAPTRWLGHHTGTAAFAGAGASSEAAASDNADSLGTAGGLRKAREPVDLKRPPPSLPAQASWRRARPPPALGAG